MPPPKAKLHKNTGRLKNITSSHGNSPSTGNRENPTSVNNQNNPNTQVERNRTNIRNDGQANTNNSGDTPAIEQFELELYWCIQTLENSLASGKLNAKQGKFHWFSDGGEYKQFHITNEIYSKSDQLFK